MTSAPFFNLSSPQSRLHVITISDKTWRIKEETFAPFARAIGSPRVLPELEEFAIVTTKSTARWIKGGKGTTPEEITFLNGLPAEKFRTDEWQDETGEGATVASATASSVTAGAHAVVLPPPPPAPPVISSPASSSPSISAGSLFNVCQASSASNLFRDGLQSIFHFFSLQELNVCIRISRYWLSTFKHSSTCLRAHTSDLEESLCSATTILIGYPPSDRTYSSSFHTYSPSQHIQT